MCIIPMLLEAGDIHWNRIGKFYQKTKTAITGMANPTTPSAIQFSTMFLKEVHMPGKEKPKKRPRGRPKNPFPPKIDADPETIKEAIFAANDHKFPKPDRGK